jgi:hypothetical protein
VVTSVCSLTGTGLVKGSEKFGFFKNMEIVRFGGFWGVII